MGRTPSAAPCGPSLFDDQPTIVENPYIRELWPPWRLMQPPANAITISRPLVSLSLAVNYAIGALDVRGYHYLLTVYCAIRAAEALRLRSWR